MSEDRDNTRELLSAYIDGEVTAEQARSIEQAVARDPELALELHELTAAKRLVMSLPRQRAPRGFVRKVMARAERKHLLGDRQAGGAFSAARWITLAVAAVVLLTAGIGIIAVNMLETGQGPSPIANLDDDGDGSGGPGHMDFNDESLHGKAGGGRNEEVGDAGGRSATTNSGAVDGRGVIADTAFEYALTNARNTSIYTHDVSNTLAVLHKSFDRNAVLPLELEATDKPVGKGSEKKRVSRGGLNFYYNKKQDTEQVQIVVMATDTVIEQLNGDLDRLADVQSVSQAPVSDIAKPASNLSVVARQAGTRGTQNIPDPSGDDREGMLIARLEGDNTGAGVGIPAKSKVAPKDGAGVTPGQTAPAPVVTPEPRAGKPAAGTDMFDGKNGPPTAVANADGQKKELIGKGDKPEPMDPKRVLVGPTTRLAETVLAAGGIRKDILDNEGSGELDALSSRIARRQKLGESGKELEQEYSKLNSAFRRQILNDNVRRNVQSQQEKGINIQALVININRRSLGNPVKGTIRLRDGEALTRPRATTTSAPVSKSTTQQATQPADTSR